MHPELTEAGASLLQAGATNTQGICCAPGKVQKNWKDLRELERLGFIRFLDVERPWITDAGRKAIGAPNELDAWLAAGVAQLPKRKLSPAPSDDPRTDFDYRSYRSMGWCCTLVVKQQDWRIDPTTIKVGRTLNSEAQYLGAGNSIVQSESEGRFILTLVPGWMIRKNIFSGYPLAIDEDDPAFTAEERAVWDRLRNICYSINARIRRGTGKSTAARSLGYGANA